MTSMKAMLFAKAGKRKEAEAAIRQAIEMGRDFGHFHHTAYNVATTYALLQKPKQAVNWLEAAADGGFPCYPLFANDPNLRSLRSDPAFKALLATMKSQWDRYMSTL